MNSDRSSGPGIELRGRLEHAWQDILSAEALDFLAGLQRRFDTRRLELLAARRERQAAIDAGESLDFLAETAQVRESDWHIGPTPEDLRDRRVEITGPVDRKMIINALNSGARCFMADFEDASSPTWSNMVEGQVNLRDAAARTIEFTDPGTGKHYKLSATPATLIVRPRGWHLEEKHLLVDGHPMSASLFDFGLYFFHNVRALRRAGTGPYFYLPKLEHHLEAQLWNEVFLVAQEALDVPAGTIKATVLIETLPAAFQMDEILHALREHIVGLNCGRWDYIFSYIKVFRNDPERVLPDRGQVTMDVPFLRAYTELLIRTCHRRGAHAMGGMAAQIPIRNDEKANVEALQKVREDKLREARAGHDGTWIAHPGLANLAMQVFGEVMSGPNQLSVMREDIHVSAADLVAVPEGSITGEGLRHNVRVGLQYLEAWLGGQGCVPLYHLMEDAATAEICRAQIWQWIRHGAKLGSGETVTRELCQRVTDETVAEMRARLGELEFGRSHFEKAAGLLGELIASEELADFLTIPAYEYLDQELQHV